MEDFFESPRALFNRANEHVEEYRKISLETIPYFEYKEEVFFDEGTQENLHAIQLSEDIDLLSVGCVAFDAISCLRSVMDQVVYAATCVITASKNRGFDPKKVKFPFSEKLTDARKQFEKKGPAYEVPVELHNILMSFEPFKGGRYGLWEFNEIRNVGIHRVIAPSAVAVRGPFKGYNGVQGSFKFVNEWDPSNRKAIFLREKDNHFYDFSYEIERIDISFGPDTELAGKRVLEALYHLSSVTFNIIEIVQQETEKIVNGAQADRRNPLDAASVSQPRDDSSPSPHP